MTFKLTNDQLIELQNARNLFPDPVEGNSLDYALLYDLVLGYIAEYQQTNTLSAEEAETVLWLEGARTVNRDIGAQSDFIRAYNDTQSQLRYGVGVSDEQMDQVSDEIVLLVIDQIIDNSSSAGISDIPSIDVIAADDAGPAAIRLFNNDPNPAGWAGNPLFLFLNHSESWNNNILHQNQPGNTDTYDLLSVVKITRDIGFENFEDLGELITASFDVADQVNSGIVLGNAIFSSEAYLDSAYGDNTFAFYSLLSVSFTNIVLGSNSDDIDDDALITTKYSDIAHSGTGNDEILGSTGSDLLDGGVGTDTVDYRTLGESLIVRISENTIPAENFIGTVQELSATPQWRDDLFNFEKIIGTNNRDIFSIGFMKTLMLDAAIGDTDKLSFDDDVNIPVIDVINGVAGDITFENFEEFSGNDQSNKFIDAAGEHKYDGKEDADTISYAEQDALQISNGQSGIKIEANLADGLIERSLISGGEIETDTIENIEKVVGASGDDVFKGKEGLVGQGFTGNLESTERGDKIDFSDYAAGVTITLGGSGTDSANGTYTTLEGIEQAVGTISGDTFNGDGSINWLFGNGAVDHLYGNGGDDHIIGGIGSDFLYGGADNDTYYFSLNAQQTLWNQSGFDIIADGSGSNDIAYLLGGYTFNPDDFTKSGTQVHISGVARTETLTDLDWVEYSDGAKFSIDRLILDEADATTFTPVNNILTGDGASNTLTASSGITEVNALGGDDWLYGVSANDLTLDGGSGSDYLFGATGNTLDGGSGNDYLDGGLDSNIKYKASSGIDVIRDVGGNGNLEISSSYTLWETDNKSLVIDHSGATTADQVIASTNKVIVLNHFNGSGIETINDIDVSTMAFKQLGTKIDDFLIGGNADDNFAASKGEDIYDGGTGANQFNFSLNDTGSTLVKTTVDGQADLLIFNGLLQSEVGVIRDASIGTNNLLFSYGQSFAVVENAVLDTANANHINVQFSDTSALTFASLDLTTRGSNGADVLDGDVAGFSIDDIIFGGAGNDTIDGGDGADTIDAGIGDDIVETGIGSDTVIDSAGDDLYDLGKGDHIFLNGSGSDRINYDGKDASSGDPLQTFVVHLPTFISSNNVVFTRDSDDQTFINIAYSGNDIDVQAAFTPIVEFDGAMQFDMSDFVLTTDGTSADDSITDYFYLDQNRSQDDIINAGGGNDDVVVSNGGVDIVYGGSGNDVIGQTELLGFPTTGSVTFYGEGGDDVLSTTTLSGSLFGGDGNDTLISNDTTDLLDGGDGDDWISAGNGTDDIQSGAGDDIILGLIGGAKTVDAGDGNDLIILDSTADDTIDGGDGLDTISFEDLFAITIAQIDLSTQTANMDGTLYSYSNIEGVIGSKGNDTITGNSANNILDGGTGFGGIFAGNDTLLGGAGNDTYVFGTPFEVRVPPNQTPGTPPAPVVGDDIVNDASGASDSIEFTDFFELSDLSFNQVGNNLVISFTDGSVTIIDHFGSGEIENLILADGTILDLNDYNNWTLGTANTDTLTGTTAGEAIYGLGSDDTINAHTGGSKLHGGFGIDTLNGDIGNDILNGGAGNDIVSGGAGDDIYIFSPGDGLDVITETSGFDILSISGAITLSDLTFTQVGDDLQIDIASGVAITDFYAGNSDLMVEEIQFDDGSIFDLTSLINTAPVAVDDNFTGSQDTTLLGNVLLDNGNGVDSDPESDPLSVVEETFLTDNGYVSIASNGAFNYSPSLGYTGQDTFIYTLEDGRGGNDTATVTIDISAGASPAPDIIDLSGFGYSSYNGSQDAGGTIEFIDSATGVEIEGNAWKKIALDYNITTDTVISFEYKSTVQGEVQGFGLETDDSQLTGAQSYQLYGTENPYTFTRDFDYTDEGNWQSFTIDVGSYQTGQIDWLTFVNDHDGGNKDGTSFYRNISIYEGDAGISNYAPVAAADLFDGDLDTDVTGNVLDDNWGGTDRDVDGDSLSVVTGTFSTTNGAVTIGTNGDFTYTPNTGFTGIDSFDYTLEDGQGGSDTGTAQIYVDQSFVPVAPIVDGVTAAQNLTDPAATLNGLSAITIVAQVDASQIGTDKGIFDTETADGSDDALTMRYDANGWLGGKQNVIKVGLQTTEGQLEFESAPDVQTTDPQHLTITWQSGEPIKLYINGILSASSYNSEALGGTITGVQDLLLGVGSKSAGGWVGTIDDFKIYDVALDAAAVNELVINSSINRLPEAFDDEFIGDKDTDVIGNVLVDNGHGVDSDIDGDPLNVVDGTYTTTNGSVVLAINGDFTYTPDAGFLGVDTFTYTLEDGLGGNDTANVQINVLLDIPSDAPIIDFTGVTFSSYNGSQDAGGTIGVIENGAGVELSGNTWKKLALDYVVTQNTVINFDYKSSIQGEIQGFGLETDDNFATGAENFQIYGTDAPSSFNQNFGYVDSGEWQSFSIDVGSYQTGQIDWLTFVNDHDGGSKDATSFYRNISIYESGSSSDDTLTGSSNDETFVGFQGNDTISGLDGDDVLFGGDGSDYLYGGADDDLLYGGTGVDMLYGQTGADTFVFEDTAASDNIQDFDLSAGDKLDVSDLLVGYDPLTDAITDFVQITESGTNSYLNVDADGGADNFVQVAYIYNETGLTDEDALEISGNLITV